MLHGNLNLLQLDRLSAGLPPVSSLVLGMLLQVGALLLELVLGDVVLLLAQLQVLGVDLAVGGERHHQLGKSHWDGVSPVNLPHVEGLSVGVHQFLHGLVFGRLGHVRKMDQTALNLVDVAVPQLLFFFGETLEYLLVYDVLNADESGLGSVAVVDHALQNVAGKVGAVVVGSHCAGEVAGVVVETADVLVDTVYGAEVLFHCGAVVQDGLFKGGRASWGVHFRAGVRGVRVVVGEVAGHACAEAD